MRKMIVSKIGVYTARTRFFFRTYVFRKLLNNVEVFMYIEFQEHLMTRCKDIEITSKMPPKWGFSPICDPQDFLQK